MAWASFAIIINQVHPSYLYAWKVLGYAAAIVVLLYVIFQFGLRLGTARLNPTDTGFNVSIPLSTLPWFIRRVGISM